VEYVIKAGNIVKKQNNIDLSINGSIFWSNGTPETEGQEIILTRKKDFYQKYSSMFYDSYKVSVEPQILRRIK